MAVSFPGATGFGQFASGGRNASAQVILVTNLNDSGSGSLRDALLTSGYRYIVPTVAGRINLTTEIVVNDNNFTLLGQLAPYPGLTVSGSGIRIADMENFVMRYIRIRVGDTKAGDSNVRGLTIRDCRLGIVDHCSISWGMDETASGWGNGGNNWETEGLSFQWNTVAEPLNDVVGGAEGGPHGFAMLQDGNKVSFHHNLICHSNSRNPQWFDRGQLTGVPADRKGLVDFRNNLVYNYYYPMRGNVIDVNIINNMYVTGPAGDSVGVNSNRFYHRPELSSVYDGERIHASGNKLLYNYKTLANLTPSDGYEASWADNQLAIRNNDGSVIANDRFTGTPHAVPVGVYGFDEDCHTSAEKIMALAGMRLYRDTHDARYIENVVDGDFLAAGSNGSQYGVIDSQSDVGGWWEPTPATGDHDIDGISIAWKNSKGLTVGVNVANDYDLDDDYPNLEVYANELVADYVDTSTPEPETFVLTTQVNTVLGGSITEVSTGQYDGEYAEGDIAEVTVTVYGGYYFTGFSSDQVPDSGTFPYSFPFPGEPVLITALFSTTPPPPPPSGASFRFVFPTAFYAAELWDAYQRTKASHAVMGASLMDINRVADKLLAFEWDMLCVPFANKDNALISLIGPDLVVSGGGGGSRFGKDGLLVTGLQNNRPRFTFDPANVGKYEGVLVERETINEIAFGDINSWENDLSLFGTVSPGVLPVLSSSPDILGQFSVNVFFDLNTIDQSSGSRCGIYLNESLPSTNDYAFTMYLKINNGISINDVMAHLAFGRALAGPNGIDSYEYLGNDIYRIRRITYSSATGGSIRIQLTANFTTFEELDCTIFGISLEYEDNFTSYLLPNVTRPADIYTAAGLINISNPYSLFEIRNGQGILRYIEPSEGTVKTYVNGAYINTDSFTPSEDLIINSQGSDKLLAAGYKSGVMTEQERINRSMVMG